MKPLTTHEIEGRLVVRLAKDRSTASRRRVSITPEEGTVITVSVSGTAYGLAIAVGARTGEEPMVVIERLTVNQRSSNPSCAN